MVGFCRPHLGAGIGGFITRRHHGCTSDLGLAVAGGVAVSRFTPDLAQPETRRRRSGPPVVWRARPPLWDPLDSRSVTMTSHPRSKDVGDWRKESEMVSAYILVQTEVGKAGQVTELIRAIDGVGMVDGVTGPYDVIARAEAADLDGLAKTIVMPMQEIEGITRTLTCPVLQL
jgi:DNA-binding Lrp family transcriptional regulator